MSSRSAVCAFFARVTRSTDVSSWVRIAIVSCCDVRLSLVPAATRTETAFSCFMLLILFISSEQSIDVIALMYPEDPRNKKPRVLKRTLRDHFG
jgi:hypothetical protein